MRELPVTVALSLLVHAAALTGYVALHDAEAPRAVTKPAPAIEVVPPAAVMDDAVDEPPVEVVLLDDAIALLEDDTVPRFSDDAPAVVTASRPAAKLAPQKAPEQIAATTTTTTELPPVTEPPQTEKPEKTEKKKSLLSMRDGRDEPVIYRPGSDGISDEALEQMAKGTIDVKIRNVPGAKESADFDKAQARLRSSKWVRNATPEELTQARWAREAARQAKEGVELKEQKDGTHTSEKTTFKATVNRDGTVDIKDKKNWQQKSVFRAEFDVTDAFMRDQGQDPYASEKRKFLDRTREQRYEIGKQYRKEQLGTSARLMAQNLARLWAVTSDPQKRKEELLALWDECAEVGDEDLVEGGAAARRLLINWVHTKKVVFTREELTAFNAKKKSKATFAP